MRVTDDKTDVTHLVASADEAIDFSIETDDPALYLMMTDSLYSDKPLAVCREIICNAWDAHIEAGKEDVPIDITLKPRDDGRVTMIIRDYGFGIPRDMMGPLYGRIGGSSKRSDQRQTGGFGLGCKVPFALAEHFEVTSWNQGTKNIYRITKSAAEKNGKPGIHPILETETSETGLQVKVVLPHGPYASIIKGLVFSGNINATLNDKRLRRMPLSTTGGDFLISSLPIDDRHRGYVFIRIGNVIYPLDDNPDYTNSYKELMEELRHEWDETFRIVIQAHPGTLAITPSRESLSLTESTLVNLRNLLNETVRAIRKERKEVEDRIDNTIVSTALTALNPVESVIYAENLKGYEDATGSHTFYGTSLFSATHLEIFSAIKGNLAHFSVMHKKAWVAARKEKQRVRRAARLVQMGLLSRNRVRDAAKSGVEFKRNTAIRFLAQLHLHIQQKHPRYFNTFRRNLYSVTPSCFQGPFEYVSMSYEQTTKPILLVLTHRVATTHYENFDEDVAADIAENVKSHGLCLAIRVTRGAKAIKDAKAFAEALTKSGFPNEITVLDLTKAAPVKPRLAPLPKPTRSSKRFASLAEILPVEGNFKLKLNLASADLSATIPAEKARFGVVYTVQESKSNWTYPTYVWRALNCLFPDQIIVTNYPSDIKKIQKVNPDFKKLDDAAIEELIKNDKEMQRVLRAAHHLYGGPELILELCRRGVLAPSLGLGKVFTPAQWNAVYYLAKNHQTWTWVRYACPPKHFNLDTRLDEDFPPSFSKYLRQSARLNDAMLGVPNGFRFHEPESLKALSDICVQILKKGAA